MDIFINTLIVLVAIQAWSIIGYIVVSQLENYEPAESHLLCCFFWVLIVIVVGWMVIKVDECLDEKFKI